MSNAVVPVKMNLPAHLRRDAAEARADAKEFSAGVTAGFPIISYRGKVWRIRKSGEEVAYVDRRGNAIQSINVVLVKSNPQPSKTFYKGKYSEGDNSPPTCWSSDGIKPDHAVQDKQHHVCASCPRNAWGSRMTEAGKKGRECSDVRRMAVMFYDEFNKKGADAHMFLMRVPPASLNPLKDYVEKALAPADIRPFAVVTEVGFDQQASHPKLTFRVAQDDDDNAMFLTEEQYDLVKSLRNSDDVTRMLTEEPDYAEAGTTDGDEAPAHKPEKATSAPAPAPKQKARPVDEEDVAIEQTAPPETADDEDDEDDEDAEIAALMAKKAAKAAAKAKEAEPAPAPPAKAKKAKAPKPSAPAPADEDESPAPAAAAPAGGKGGFDDLLDSLLG